MTINVSGTKAIECIFVAHGIKDIPVDVIISICNEDYNNSIIEFTKITKERICKKVGIGVDMLNKYIKRLIDNNILLPVSGRGVYMISCDWVMELMSNRFNVNLVLSTETPITKTDTYKQGILTYDSKQERYTIVSENQTEIINNGLHCGDSFEVFHKGIWTPTRIEMRHTKNGESWYLTEAKNKRKLDNLKVRILVQ